MNPISLPRRPKIGILALTLELYEKLAPGLRESREAWVRSSLLPWLERHVDVLFEKAVFRLEDVASAVSHFEQQGADGLLVLLLTYSPSQLALPALKRTALPILIWNTQELSSVTESFTVSNMIDNHGVHGTQDLANVLKRAEISFEFVTSPARDPHARQTLLDFYIAAMAAKQLNHLRIGMLGHPFPGMGDFGVDTTHLASTLGCAWVHLTLEEYLNRSRQAASADVAGLIAEYRHDYDIGQDVTDADLDATARAELALRGMVAENQLGALTYQFQAFGEDERTSTLPFVAASRLMAEGIGFGGEGDLVGAAGTVLLHLLQPPATFSEMFTIDFEGESVFMSHMGEANVAMSRKDRKAKLVARPSQITRTRDRQLAVVTCLEPGPATLFALASGPGGRWRCIASRAAVENFGPLPDFYVPHFKLKPAMPVCNFLTAYATAGGPHHNAVCFGDARRRIRFAAALLGADYIEI